MRNTQYFYIFEITMVLNSTHKRIVAFPLQQSLRECAQNVTSMFIVFLRYKYVNIKYSLTQLSIRHLFKYIFNNIS
jgi:hypothetical protein